MATFSFGPNANQSVFSQRSRAIVNQILDAAGLVTCKITSTSRTPADQARAMFNNIGNTTVTEIEAAMTAKIIQIGPGKSVITARIQPC